MKVVSFVLVAAASVNVRGAAGRCYQDGHLCTGPLHNQPCCNASLDTTGTSLGCLSPATADWCCWQLAAGEAAGVVVLLVGLLPTSALIC
jgi:hypothetical protein